MKEDKLQDITYSITNMVCSATVLQQLDKGTANFEIQVHESPLDEFMGPISAVSIYSSSSDNKYKKGQLVKVLVPFVYNNTTGKFEDTVSSPDVYILGSFDDEKLVDVKVDSPLIPDGEDSTRFLNKKSKAGMSIDDNGQVTIATAGGVYEYFSAGGFGTDRNAKYSNLANDITVLTGLNDFNTAIKHFGYYLGDSDEESALVMTMDDKPVINRRFIPLNANIKSWVSTCEGTHAPFVGPNNDSSSIKSSKGVLYTKIVNVDKKRFTIEVGEEGSEFLNMRIDNVISNEKRIATKAGASTAVLGNTFSFTVGDDGSFKIMAGGVGTVGVKKSGIHIEGTASGKLIVNASGGIEMSTGSTDKAVNSISIGAGVVKIMSAGSFVVNGVEVLTKRFSSWMMKNLSKMFLPIPPQTGGPVSPNPDFMKDGLKKDSTPEKAGGFSTSGVPIPPAGLNTEIDDFVSI